MEAQDIVDTWYWRAFEEGRREGFQEALLAALQLRFGVEVDARVEQRVARASLDQLEIWTKHALSASSLPELLTIARSPAAALLTEIIADPRSIEPRLVYADALLEAGDPRGELIHVQCALESLHADDPARAKLEARAADLLALHEPTWTQELRELCTLYENSPRLVFRRGFVESATLYASHVREIVASMATQTPLRELSLLHEDPVEELAVVPALAELEALELPGKATAEDLARAFARWPHSGQLRSLAAYHGAAAARAVARTPALAGLASLSLPRIDREAVMALASAAHLASLRTLRLRDAELDGAGIEALGRSEALREIEVLDLEAARRSGARGQGLEVPAFPSLRELRCNVERLVLKDVSTSVSGLRLLLAAPFAARLRSLELGPLDPDEAALLAAADLPELRVLSAGDFDDRAAAILARARTKPWLQRLVLTGHDLTDEGAIAIANATGLDRLASLWLVAPEVTASGATALRKRFGHRVGIFSGGSPSWSARTSPF